MKIREMSDCLSTRHFLLSLLLRPLSDALSHCMRLLVSSWLWRLPLPVCSPLPPARANISVARPCTSVVLCRTENNRFAAIHAALFNTAYVRCQTFTARTHASSGPCQCRSVVPSCQRVCLYRPRVEAKQSIDFVNDMLYEIKNLLWFCHRSHFALFINL